MRERLRLSEIDFFKGICIVAVVAIHMSGIIVKGGKLPIGKIDDYYLFSIITRFCVPGFILASGLLLAIKSEKIDYRSFLKNKALYILIPYIIWTLVYTYFWSYLNKIPRINYWSALLYGYGSYHLYFVLIIIQFYLIYLLFKGFLNKIKAWYLLILFVFQIILNWWAKATEFSPINYNYTTSFLPWIFIFIFGYFVGRNYNTFKSNIIKYRAFLWTGLCLSLIYQLTRYLEMYFVGVNPRKIPDGTVIVLTLFIFATVISYSNELTKSKDWKIIKLVKRLGVISFGIYLVHPLFIPIFSLLINPFFREVPTYMIYFEYLFTILLSWSFSELLSRIKFLKLVIGR